uniref:Flagellar hook-length control protein-like C-terminal domain-containing protein n=1 Tax=Phenylobacterium glaciei TaxID=2803784 RepID=A0A974P2J4_9CAUL|nr:hypothetical protein JKL49_21585 [Phenylobacterium glaciei]
MSSADPLTAKAVAHTETAATFDSGSEGKREEVAVAVEAKADVDTGQPAAPNVADAAAAASTAAPAEMRAGPQTVAHLAAQIVKKLEGRSTQFDVALNPEGLGRVDVRIEIGAQGRLTASMSFENPRPRPSCAPGRANSRRRWNRPASTSAAASASTSPPTAARARLVRASSARTIPTTAAPRAAGPSRRRSTAPTRRPTRRSRRPQPPAPDPGVRRRRANLGSVRW